ncbi:MAG: hypothetical protein ACLPYS_06810 [Vulcanimicrobiaceae bacterium]
MSLVRAALCCAAALAVAAPALAQNTLSTMGKGTLTYNFKAQNNSGETGTVILKPDGKKTVITITLAGAPASAQPAHVHPGTCAKLDPRPAYPLSNVLGGSSTTTLDVPLAKLTGGGYAVNVHKSLNELAVYVACADLSAANMPAMDMPTAAPTPGPVSTY